MEQVVVMYFKERQGNRKTDRTQTQTERHTERNRHTRKQRHTQTEREKRERKNTIFKKL